MNKKVLVVDDEEVIVELLTEILGDFNDFTVYTAQNGDEALRLTREHHPDVVLLDIQLPKKNGIEVCRTIKSDPLTADVKVVMLTGLSQVYANDVALDAGADSYITKPFSSYSLVNKVCEMLACR